MTPSDFKVYQEKFPEWSGGIIANIDDICLLSPNQHQYDITKNVFPTKNLHVKTINDWNLNQPSSEKFDLAIACNVMHYSPNPKLWARNILGSCKIFWVQDLINRKRSWLPDNQLGDDGDSSRYYYRNHTSSQPDSVNIEDLGEVTKFHFFLADKSQEDSKLAEHFLCEIKRNG